MLPAPLAAATFVAEHRPMRDEHALTALARWAALRFSPLVATDVAAAAHVGMDGLLLDISGCEHLFGGELALISVLLRKARKHGLTCAAAVASTPAAAWALARYGPAPSASLTTPDPRPLRDQLAPLPLAALRLAPATLEALARVGLFRIGEVLALPRASLPVRFGPELLLHLDQALGHAMHPLVPVTVPQPLRTTLPFSGPTTNYEAVMLAVRTTLATLCELLMHRALGTRLLRLRLHRVDAPPVDFLIRLSAPSHDPAHLWALLRSAGEGIENAHLGFGVEGVTVISLRSGPVQEHQRAIPLAPLTSLTLAAPNSHAAPPLTLTTHTAPPLSAPPQLPSPPLPPPPPPAELIDQLATRLGPDRVLFPTLVSSHLPESSSALTRAMETGGNSTSSENPSISRHQRARPRARPNKSALASPPLAELSEPAASSAHRPPRLFEKAEPALVVALVPGGPPVRITWRDCEHTVLCALGPEHLKEAWWSTGSSCDLALRQYFRVQLDDGRWLFVLRRQDTPPRSATRWFVHGLWC